MESELQRLLREASEAEAAAVEANRRAQEALAAASRGRDFMIGATYHVLKGLIQSRQVGGARATLKIAKKFGGSEEFSRDGSYQQIRRSIAEMLMDLDLLDQDSNFKYFKDL